MNERERGMTLMEASAAVALLGIAVLTASALLANVPGAAARVDAGAAAVRALESAIETLRASPAPLRPARWTEPAVAAAGPMAPVVTIEVTRGSRPGLYRVHARARCMVRGQPVERELETLIWRP